MCFNFSYSYHNSKNRYLSDCLQWIDSPELGRLVKAFGSEMPKELEGEQKLDWLCQFSERWDFRKNQSKALDLKTGERARWMVSDADLSEEQKSSAVQVASRLGMLVTILPARKSYDSILVLGGARMSCLYRTRYAGELLKKQLIEAGEIVGLTGMRPILESERSATDTYAVEAATEFDLMCRATEQVFAFDGAYKVEQKSVSDVNLAWAVAEYGGMPPVVVLAAPSSEPERRRANTVDTFRFWIEKKGTQKGKHLLLVTSQIYVPYQQLEATRTLGFEYGCIVETIGFPREWSGRMQGMQTAENYLQEIRSVLQSMKRLM